MNQLKTNKKEQKIKNDPLNQLRMLVCQYPYLDSSFQKRL